MLFQQPHLEASLITQAMNAVLGEFENATTPTERNKIEKENEARFM